MNRNGLALATILFLAALLRLPMLGAAPPGIFRDELEKGYTALELWTTGRHAIPGTEPMEVSRLLPVFIETFAGHDRTSAIYQYASAPIVGVFGLGAVTTRLAAALAGIAACAAVWWLGLRLLGPLAATAAGAAMAFHPTGIIFSRWAQQGIFAVALAPAGFALLEEMLRARAERQRALGVVGGLVLGVAAYAYDPARLCIPAMLAVWVAVRGRTGPRGPVLWGIAAFAAVWIPLAAYTVTAGSSRLGRVGIFGEGIGPGMALAAKNYLAHFAPGFWLGGDANPRHRLESSPFAGYGALALMLAAAVAAFRAPQGEERGKWLCLAGWLLCAPAAAALTREGIPHALRANLLIPCSALIAGAGAAAIMGRGARGIAAVAVLLALDAGVAVRGLRLLANAHGGAWEAGTQEAMRHALARPGAVYLSPQVPYAIYVALFAERTDPRDWHERGLAALRTRLAPPESPFPGDTLLAPPGPGMPIEFHEENVIVTEFEPAGTVERRGTEVR